MRIVLDPLELAALATLCRNASYDAAGIASEARYRCDAALAGLSGPGPVAEASQLAELAAAASQLLLRAAGDLDDDALLLAAIGQRSEAADSIAEAFGVGEHALLAQLRADTNGGTP